MRRDVFLSFSHSIHYYSSSIRHAGHESHESLVTQKLTGYKSQEGHARDICPSGTAVPTRTSTSLPPRSQTSYAILCAICENLQSFELHKQNVM